MKSDGERDDEDPVFAIKGEDHDTYYKHIRAVLEGKPQITMDDGADLVSMLHSDLKSLLPGVIGGTEETTTGVIRLKAMAKDKVLGYPIIAVNDSETKHLFDNRYGTGQSTLDGIMRATNRLSLYLRGLHLFYPYTDSETESCPPKTESHAALISFLFFALWDGSCSRI